MNWSAELVELVPIGVVTVISTVACVSAGEVAVMEVGPFTVKAVADVDPNFTAVAPLNAVPVTVTEVAPVVGPTLGLTAVTVGTGGEAIINVAADEEIPAGDWAAVGETAPETLGL